nr:spermatogenesis-associated protein 31D1 isoform X3 [Oryctolagus cuniculus]
MEQVLLFLKSHAEPWQSFSSVYLDTVPSCIFLIVVGLLLLYLCYLLLPTKHPGRAKRRQKGGTFRGWRSHRRKTEETRKLLSILKSPLGHHHDSTPFRHMLCPEPSCEVCNRTTAEIQQLLSQGSLQHAALSQYFSPSSDSMIESSVSLTSDLLAIAPGDPIPPPVPEPSPSPCSTLSTNLDTSFEDLISPSNLPPKPTPGLDFSFPGGHFPTQPLRILPPPPCPGQGTDPVLQGEVTVTLGDSVCGLPTHEPKTKATQSPDMATSEIWPQGRTKHLPISNWAQGDAKQNILALSSSKAPIGVDREASLLGNLLFLSPDALALLERQVRKRGDFLIHREREKTAGPFPKQHRPDVPLHSPGKMLESVSVKHDSAVSLPHWSSKGKPQEMHLDQQSLYSKTFEDHLQKKCIQLPWDRPALNHDFLYPAGLVSGRCSSTLVVFSSVYDTSTAQEPPAVPDPQAQESPELPDPQAQDSPELPDPQTQESPELPDPQAQDSPELPDPQAQDSPVVPDPQAQESPELPDPQAQNSPDRPDPQAQESSTVPDPQAQESPELPDPQPLLEPEIQSQPLPQDMRQPQSQVPTENQPQSSVPILPPYSLPQISTSGVGLHELLNEAEALLPSETQHLEHHLLKKKQENLWGLPSVVCKSQKDFCPPTPNLSLVSQSSKPHISISILPGDFVLNSELREKLEHHLLKRLIQNRWGLPCKVLESLFLINPQRDGSDTSESKSNQDLSGVCLFKGQISKDVVDLGLSQPGSFYKRTLEILPLEDVRKSRRPTQESGLSDHLMSDSRKSSDMDLWSDSEEDLECQVLNLSGNNSRASCMSLNEKQLENDLKANLSKKGKEIKESPIRRTLPGSQHSIKKTLPLSEKSCRRGKQKDSVPLVSRTSNVNTSNEISFLCSSNKKMLEYHIKSFRLRMIWGLPKKVLDSIEVFKMKEELAQCTDHYNFPSSANLISEVDSQLSVSQSFTDSISLLEDKVGTRICDSDLDHQFPATTAVHKPCRGSSISLHGNKVGTRVSDSSLDRSFPTTSPVCKPYRGSSISLHGGKVGTRVSDSSLDCPFPATSPVCKPSRKNSVALHGHKLGRRVSVSSLDHSSPATSPVREPFRGSSISLHGDKVGTRVCVSDRDHPFPAISTVCKPNSKSSVVLQGHKVGRRVSLSNLDHPFPVTSPVCKPCRGNSVAFLGDKIGRRISVPGLDHTSPATSPVCKPHRANSIAFLGDRTGRRVSDPRLDRPSPPTSHVCRPHRANSVALLGDRTGRRVTDSRLDRSSPPTSPVCRPLRGSPIFLHGDKVGIRISVSDPDRPSRAPSPVNEPYSVSCISLHGDKVRTRVSDSSLCRPAATSLESVPCRGSSISLHGGEMGRRISSSSLDHHFPVTSPVSQPYRGSCISLHGDKLGIKISFSDLDHPFPLTSHMYKPYRGSSIALHGDKVGTRVSDSSLDRPSPATSPVCMPCRGSSISFHGDKVGIRISAPGLDHDFPATSPVCKPYRGSSMSFLGNMIGKRMSVSNVDHHFPATSTVCRCYRGSSISLHGDKVGTRISNPDPDDLFPVTSPVCRPYRGSSISLHGDKVGTRISNPDPDGLFPVTSPVCRSYRGSSISLHGDKVGTRLSMPGLDRPFPPPSPVCKPYRGSSISLHGDKVGTRLSMPGLDRPFPPPSPVCKPYRGSSISLHGDKVGTRLSIPGLDRPFPSPSPVCKPYRGSSISLQGDKVGTRLSIPGLDRPFPSPSPVCKPCRGTAISLHGDKVGTRLSVSGLDRLFPHPSPVSKPCRGDFTALHGDKVGARICAISMDHHSSVTSPVCKKRQGVLRKTSCDITYERIDDIQRLNDCRKHFLPCTDDAIDKARQKPPALANRCSPTLPRRQIMAGPEPSDNTGISRNRTERLQGKHLKNLEHFPTDKKSVEIFRARERCALPSPWSKTFTTNEPKSSPVIGMTLGEKRTMLTSKHPPPKISEPRNSKLSGINTKLLCELKLNLDNTDDRQTHDHSTDPSLASGNLKCRPALTYTRGTHTRHTADSQVWHVHGENTGISREQMQEPCVPVCVLRKNQGKNLPAASKTVSPPEPKPEELGGGDAGLGPSQPRRRIRAAQGGTLKDTLESKYSPTQPLKGQPPAESHFRKRMKHFLQWIWPSRRCERQNRFLEQGRSLSSEQSMGPGKNQATCIGNTEVQSVKPASGKVPGKKLGHDHGTGKTCHQVPLSTQVKFSKTQRQAELQMGAAPVQGHPFNHRVTSCKGTSTKSCRQEAAFAGQSYPARNTHMKHRDREPKKVVPFRDQLWCQRYPERACATSKPCL